MRRLALVAAAAVLSAAPALAQEAPAAEPTAPAEAEAETQAAKAPEAPPIQLAELLKRVRAQAAAELANDVERETAFRRARDEQAEALRRTEALVRAEEAEGIDLDTRYGENELEIEVLSERLTERLGQMGELFGVVRLVATDTSANAWDSMTSAGIPDRKELLDRLGRSTDLPSTNDLEQLWFEVQREMTEQGRIVRATLPVLSQQSGETVKTPREIVRVGPFVAISDVGYLMWEKEEQLFRTMKRQPPGRYVNTAEAYLDSDAAFRTLAVDPSRGVLLEALTDTPSLVERVQQGGYVGYTILALGAFALALGVFRAVGLTLTSRRVDVQARSERASDDNPLGRVMGVYEANRHSDPEALELRLDEVVLRESSRLQRYLWIVQTVSIIAPLLGLLGTVTGMIQTFQAITLFGAGDPKMMASGISEALVTTTLGLVIAIPLVLLHALLNSRTRRIADILDERSSAALAERIGEGVAS